MSLRRQEARRDTRNRKDPPVSVTGVELTDEGDERLADEAEAGYDLGQGEVLHTGRRRPSLASAPSEQRDLRGRS